MDIANISMTNSQNNVLNAVGASMLSKSMDLAGTEVAMLTESLQGLNMNAPSLESLVYPTSGTQIDMRV